MLGLLGKKIGMTRIYNKDGVVIPVTVIEAGPCTVIQMKTLDKDKYNALKVGYENISENKINLPKKKQFEKVSLKPMKFLKEFRLRNPLFKNEYKIGQQLKVDIFKIGEKVKISGTSKGHGFQGVVKRHGFSGGDEAHGCKSKRVPGSIGQCQTPGHVIKGKKLPGHFGNKKISVLKLEIVGIDLEKNLLIIKGAVPGANKGLLRIEKMEN
ncbi:MAG: 50S ribosomal protein L3 [Candidatus Coatesbacteria bacterium]|nr:50S ribosomal protein L3 [Candidatus Coatesbacteria bacterium]